MPSVIRASTRSSVASLISAGVRVFSEARICLAREGVGLGMSDGDTSELREDLQNYFRERWRHSVGNLFHLVRKRAVNAKPVRESLKPGRLAYCDAAWLAEMGRRRSMAGE